MFFHYSFAFSFGDYLYTIWRSYEKFHYPAGCLIVKEVQKRGCPRACYLCFPQFTTPMHCAIQIKEMHIILIVPTPSARNYSKSEKKFCYMSNVLHDLGYQHSAIMDLRCFHIQLCDLESIY